jgi:hypothetical protein
LCFAPGAGSQIGQDEEPTAGMNPTRRFQNQAGLFSSLAWCAQAESERRDVA